MHQFLKAVIMTIFRCQKKIDIFLIFALNIDCGYTLELPDTASVNKAVLTSIHKLYFKAKKM